MNIIGGNQADESSGTGVPPFVFLDYHRRLRRYLEAERPDLWHWFSADKHRAEAADTSRRQLLKTACRLERESASVLYLQCDAVLTRMQLNAAVTLYQAQQAAGRNVSLCWLPDEVHIILHGPVQELLNESEMEAVFAHEFAHYELLTIDDGVFETVEEILQAMLNDRVSHPSFERTWRNYHLYTELHCDRRAAELTEDPNAAIRALIKLETGQSNANADAYLAQANEVLNSGKGDSERLTHPELFIRAKALSLWQGDSKSVAEIVRPLIEGAAQPEALDLLQQHELQKKTKQFLKVFLQPEWLQTSVMLGFAGRFSEDGIVSIALPDDPDLSTLIGDCDGSLSHYFCFILLDLATCDPDLEEAPLAAAFLFAGHVGLAESFQSLAATELKIGKRALNRVWQQAASIVEQAEAEFMS